MANFQQAIKWLRQGYAVRRKLWADNGQIRAVADLKHDFPYSYFDILQCKTSNGKWSRRIDNFLTLGMLEAKDWEKVK